ncbi:MAG TPA: hypothetical protein VFU94_12320 [Conexibacter sp.]|nr:hypothetical protein [Conexibacter sp.]
MAVLVAERVERPAMLFDRAPGEPDPAAGARRPDRGPGGGLTLDEAIVGAWEGLAARVAVPCPVCGGRLRPRVERSASAGGRCGDCGTTLD